MITYSFVSQNWQCEDVKSKCESENDHTCHIHNIIYKSYISDGLSTVSERQLLGS